MNYLLDANTFIEAKNRYYRFGICPGYWDWLREANASGTVFSVVGVQSELTDGDDELAEWAEGEGEKLFLSPDDNTLKSFAEISQWVVDGEFKEEQKQVFLARADPLLVAHAASHKGFTVVTQEVLVSGNSLKVKIPNVCEAFDVPYMNTFDFLEAEGARFALG